MIMNRDNNDLVDEQQQQHQQDPPPSNTSQQPTRSLPPPIPYPRIFLENHPPAPILNINIDWDNHHSNTAPPAPPPPNESVPAVPSHSNPLPSIPFSPHPPTPNHPLLPFSPAVTSNFPSNYHFSLALQQQLPHQSHSPITTSLLSSNPLPFVSPPPPSGAGSAGAGPSTRRPSSRNTPDWVGGATAVGVGGVGTTSGSGNTTAIFSTPNTNNNNNANTGMSVLPEPALPPLSHMLSSSSPTTAGGPTTPTTTKTNPQTVTRIPSARGGVRKRALQHSCHLCSYRAHQSSDLKRHLATHQDLRPFRCPECEHSFRQKAHLNAHRLAIHSRLKPHRCDVCSRTFAARSSLKRHVTYVHNKSPPFFCPSCPAQFQRVFDCSRHQAAMHGRNRTLTPATAGAPGAVATTSNTSTTLNLGSPSTSNQLQRTPILPPMPNTSNIQQHSDTISPAFLVGQQHLPLHHHHQLQQQQQSQQQARIVRSPSLPIRSTSRFGSSSFNQQPQLFMTSDSNFVRNTPNIGVGAAPVAGASPSGVLGRGLQDTIEGLLAPNLHHPFVNPVAAASRSIPSSSVPIELQHQQHHQALSGTSQIITRAPSLPHISPHQSVVPPNHPLRMHRSASTSVVGRRRRDDESLPLAHHSSPPPPPPPQPPPQPPSSG